MIEELDLPQPPVEAPPKKKGRAVLAQKFKKRKQLVVSVTEREWLRYIRLADDSDMLLPEWLRAALRRAADAEERLVRLEPELPPLDL